MAGSAARSPLLGPDERVDVEGQPANTRTGNPGPKKVVPSNGKGIVSEVAMVVIGALLVCGAVALASSGLEVPDYLDEDDRCAWLRFAFMDLMCCTASVRSPTRL